MKVVERFVRSEGIVSEGMRKKGNHQPFFFFHSLCFCMPKIATNTVFAE